MKALKYFPVSDNRYGQTNHEHPEDGTETPDHLYEEVRLLCIFRSETDKP